MEKRVGQVKCKRSRFKSQRETMMISDLPLDVESEILSRVPATSLSQFRYTCKRWCALFKDPRFVKKNLAKAATTQVILNKDKMVYSGSINLHGIHNGVDPSFELTGKLNSLKDSEHVEIYEIFHCDGLILCTTKYDRLVVWNPCTGQTKWTQPMDFKTFYRFKNAYFLGYENNKSSVVNYKILCFRNLLLGRIEIREFSSDSWRVLDGATDWYKWLQTSRGVSLKGNTYWFDKYYKEEGHCFGSMIMFDFTTERFGRLSIPFKSYNYGYMSVVLSVVREEKLALLRFDIDSLEMKIWVTNTKIDEAKDLSWSDFLVVDCRKFMMITDMEWVVSFLVDEENKMVVCCNKDIQDEEGNCTIYIVGENMHKEVYSQPTNKEVYNQRCLLSYVPSLAHI